MSDATDVDGLPARAHQTIAPKAPTPGTTVPKPRPKPKMANADFNPNLALYNLLQADQQVVNQTRADAEADLTTSYNCSQAAADLTVKIQAIQQRVLLPRAKAAYEAFAALVVLVENGASFDTMLAAYNGWQSAYNELLLTEQGLNALITQLGAQTYQAQIALNHFITITGGAWAAAQATLQRDAQTITRPGINGFMLPLIGVNPKTNAGFWSGLSVNPQSPANNPQPPSAFSPGPPRQ